MHRYSGIMAVLCLMITISHLVVGMVNYGTGAPYRTNMIIAMSFMVATAILTVIYEKNRK